MNAGRLLLLPWWATSKTTRGLITALIGLLTLACVVAAMHVPREPHFLYGVCCVFNLVVWVLLMPNTMVLARDARMLRLPHLECDAVLSLIVYAIALVVMPGLAVTAPGLNTMQAILSLAIFAAAPMAYMCLPGYLSAFIIFGWLFSKHIEPAFAASIGQIDFTMWAVPMLLLLLLAIAWGWRRTVRGAIAAASYSAPMVLKLRTNAWKGQDKVDVAFIRQRPDWMRAQPDLSRCGPGYGQRSLRVAFGGLYLPQRWPSRLRTWGWAALWSSLFVVFDAVQVWSQHPQAGWELPWRAGLFSMLAWGVGFGATMVALVSLLRLTRIWQNVTGELSLLALLPGLRARRDLLRAMVLPPLHIQLALLALSLLCALALHLHTEALAFILVTQVGAFAFVVVFALLIAGGRLPKRWVIGALGCVAFVLLSASLFVPAMSDASTIKLPTGDAAMWLVCGWISLGAVLFWLGYRGWCGFVERPHPFLPNGI